MEEELLFDPTLKKKKKKKDILLELQEEPDKDNKPKALDETKPFNLNDLSEALQDKDLGKDSIQGSSDFDLSLLKKKKKKKNVVTFDDMDGAPAPIINGEFSNDTMENIWSNDRDYTYEELLTRVFDIMRDKNPDIVAGEKKRLVMKPPQVVRVGTKKTSFVNFHDICKMLHRQPKHLLAFLLAELGTSGSVDGNNQLIIKGKFQQKQIENILRRYIKEYVTCHTCHSPETLLQKDTRLYFLQCEKCGSRCSVAAIKSGFQAVTGKRAAIRAKGPTSGATPSAGAGQTVSVA